MSYFVKEFQPRYEEQTRSKSRFVKKLHFCTTKIHLIEPQTTNLSFVKTIIGWLEKRWKNQMEIGTVPSFLWDCSLIYEVALMSFIASSYDGRTGKAKIKDNMVTVVIIKHLFICFM